MPGEVVVVGVGPGDPAQLTAAARAEIERAEVLIGAARLVAPFRRPGVTVHESGGDYTAVARLIESHGDQPVAVLASGDVGFFSIAAVLGRGTSRPLRLVPGISSLQYLCACIGESWADVVAVSLHGRRANVLGHVLGQAKTFFLLGDQPTAADVCRLLCQHGLGELPVVVGERLSYPEQRISRGTARELSDGSFDRLAVMLVYNDRPAPASRDWVTPGLPDELFIRGEVPMTKELVRAACVSKLRLAPRHVVYDIGAGTGSVAVECALQARLGVVFAVERSADACELIERNARHFAVHNLLVVNAEAPAGLAELPPPDRVFVGGSGGRLPAILDLVGELNPDCRIVVNAILLESAADAVRALRERRYVVEVVQVAATVGRPVTAGTLMVAQNPVYVISAQCQGPGADG